VSENSISPREQILTFIDLIPGSHLRKIQKKLTLPLGTIQYHLKVLEREGKIKSVRTKFYKNYYSSRESDEQILAILNLDSPRKIIQFLAKNESVTHQQICKAIGLTSSTVSWHMKRLVELGLVQIHYEKKFKIYSLKNRNEVLKCLARRKPPIQMQLCLQNKVKI